MALISTCLPLFVQKGATMLQKEASHLKAVLLALFVTVLWSSSWVLVKIGLQSIPPLTFAGLRYFLAFLVLLLVLAFNPTTRREIRILSPRNWLLLTLLGLLFYTATQGLSFIALSYLKAATLSLLLNFTSVVVAVLGIFWLAETPGKFQWLGLFMFLAGAVVYFDPKTSNEPAPGLIVGVLVLTANAASALLGRRINRAASLAPLTVTFISMGVGSAALLGLGLSIQGLPRLDLSSWIIVGWLAIVNSAFAFTLWNATQRSLTATQSSTINNTMLIQIPIFAWLFLGEQLARQEIGGLAFAALGALLVQWRVPQGKPVPGSEFKNMEH